MEVKDQTFSFEIARRSVGRAAFHLGITSMTESTLDVLADILLQYLSRTGKAMAHLVESSGRTSAHVNILDAFQACEVVSSPAIQRLHLAPDVDDPEQMMLMGASSNAAAVVAQSDSGTKGAAASAAAAATVGGGSGNQGGPPTNGGGKSGSASGGGSGASAGYASFGQDSSTDWKGLAAFCFGPKWLEETDDVLSVQPAPTTRDPNRMEIEEEDEDDGIQVVGRGGKQGPSAKAVGADGVMNSDSDGQGGGLLGNYKAKGNKGWNAPYLDEVPEFPTASATCANPHALPSRVRKSLHYRKTEIDPDEAEEDEEAEQSELEHLPDDVFVTEMKAATSSTEITLWGIMKKRKMDVDDETVKKEENTGSPRHTKRVRLNDGSAAGLGGSSGAAISSTNFTKVDHDDGKVGTTPAHLPYVPSFYPPPPSTKEVVERGRTVVDMQEEQRNYLLQRSFTYNPVPSSYSTADDSIYELQAQGVRSSLVHLGQFYWGSGWDDDASSSAISNSMVMEFAVSKGRPPDGHISSYPEDPIVPMSRASQSRVSRILEGSMDAAAMQ